MNIWELRDWLKAVEDGHTVDIGVPMKHFEELLEIARLADLVNAEFKSDPMSVQCFDLNAIVHPLDEALKKLEAV